MDHEAELAGEIRRMVGERFGGHGDLPDRIPGGTTLHGLMSHRSHRAYTGARVDDDVLRLLFACALSAPSKSDLQQADIIQVRNARKRRFIADLIPSMPWVSRAPVFLIFCGNNRRLRQLSAMHGTAFANDHLDAFFNAAVDAGIVMATFIHAAEAAGLGCCPISAVRDHAADIGELLGLPDWVFPVAGMCVGYPADEGHVSKRLPMEVSVHTDAFDESRLEQSIHDYDRRRARDMPEAERYHWSEAKAKQYSEPQRADFGAYVRGRGFDLS